MPSWNELLNLLESQPDPVRYVRSESLRALRDIGRLRGDRHVILYGSAFLQKPQAPADRLQITPADLNAFMSVMHGMCWRKNLTLILHTPGGVANAAETIVAYLRSYPDELSAATSAYVAPEDVARPSPRTFAPSSTTSK